MTMNLPDFYPTTVLVLSSIGVVLFSVHLIIIVAEYRDYHDERAARSLLLALLLLLVAVGTLLSASGFFLPDYPGLPAFGLGILRGALLVGGVTLLLMDFKVGHGD